MVVKGVGDLNPRSQAVKGMEMTVLRAIQLIEAFDALEPDQDWLDVPGSTYRKVIGERYEFPRLIEEVYKRWKEGTLYLEVLDLAENLPPASLERQEIANGVRDIRSKLGSGGKKRPPRPAPGKRH